MHIERQIKPFDLPFMWSFAWKVIQEYPIVDAKSIKVDLPDRQFFDGPWELSSDAA